MISVTWKTLLLLATLTALPAWAREAAPLAEGFDVLAARCAPSVHPSTLAAVVRQESGFNPLAIGVNGADGGAVKVRSLEEAVTTATRLLREGRNIDLGLGQINSANLDWLGLSVREAFDPCRNLAAAARVLADNYLRYRPIAGSEQAALDAALSAYNTGSRTGGLRNGYVAKVRRAAGLAVALTGVPVVQTAAPAPTWDVFGRSEDRAAGEGAGVLVFGGLSD